MDDKEHDKLLQIADDLYRVNAYISLHFIAIRSKPTPKEIDAINVQIGEAIRQLRLLTANVGSGNGKK